MIDNVSLMDGVKKTLGDLAMLKTPEVGIVKESTGPGGIDLNQINVNRAGRRVIMQFDPAQLNELMKDGFEGFMPVIINITPVSDPLPLLGISSRQDNSSLS